MRLAISLLAPLLLLASAAPARAAEHPSISLSNGVIEAEMYLPDPEKGYYRGTRFDWSGAISSLTYKGHDYFGEWQDSDDPYLHDRITGPVEEYRPEGDQLGYKTAPVGGGFLRIGVGVVEKPDEEEYSWRTGRYEVIDPGKWTVKRGENWVEMTHEVSEPVSGYGYRLTKRLTLTPGRPELVIDHFLANTGEKTIDTTVYNHNFFVIDGRPTGPEFEVKFPFEVRAEQDLKGYAAGEGREIVYSKELPEGESIFTPVTGFGDTAADNAFTIRNRETGAGVRVSGDRALHSLNYWSPRTTLCPEPFVAVRVAPGEADRWVILYEFFEAE